MRDNDSILVEVEVREVCGTWSFREECSFGGGGVEPEYEWG